MTNENNKIMPETAGPVLCLEVRHKVREEFHSSTYIPLLEKMYKEHGEIRILYYYPEPESFPGWEEKAALNDFDYFTANGKRFAKIAIVNAPKNVAQRWDFMSPLLGGELREFDKSELNDAQNWIKS